MALAALKDELDTWDAALNACDAGNVSGALTIFERISDTSRILVNIALIHMAERQFELAVEKFGKALALDHFLAIAYFQRGVCYFQLEQMEKALQDFEDAELMMRGNDVLHYRELGLPFDLHITKIRLNRGLTLVQLKRETESPGQENDEQQLYSMPSGLLFRPPFSKRLFLQQLEQASGTNGKPFVLPPISPPSPMSSAPFASEPKSDSSSTYAPSASDRDSIESPKRDSIQDEKQRDQVHHHQPFPSNTSYGSSSSSTPFHLRTDLIKVMGPDLIPPTTEISTIPCAGVRIASGKLTGLMCWRLIVELMDADEQGSTTHHRQASWAWKQKGKGTKGSLQNRPAVVSNFILDTGCSKSVISQEMLRALGYRGKYTPGSEINHLRIQGIRTPCVVARLGEASRLGGQFMTSGSLTFYFDTKLNAPVLYAGDEANERPALDSIHRTVTAVDPFSGRIRRKSFRRSVSSIMSALNLLKVGA